MKGKILASRYAKAVFELAVEQKMLDEIYNDMKLIKVVLEQNKDLTMLMKSPVIKPSKKKAIIKAVFEDKIHPLSKKFIDILIVNGRESFLKEVTEEFEALYNEHNNIIKARLTTAVEIEPAVAQEIEALLKKQTGANIDLEKNVNENIIGGFILDYDDYEYDSSIKLQLARLKKRFEKNLYIKNY